jgi:hypothetical protein
MSCQELCCITPCSPPTAACHPPSPPSPGHAVLARAPLAGPAAATAAAAAAGPLLFRRQDFLRAAGAPAGHPLLLRAAAARAAAVEFTVPLGAGPRLAFLWDHVVAGRPLLPAAAFLEMGAAAGRALLSPAGGGAAAAPALRGTVLAAPCVLPAAEAAPAGAAAPAVLVLSCAIDPPTGALTLSSGTVGGKGAPAVHVRSTLAAQLATPGTKAHAAAGAAGAAGADALRAACRTPTDVAAAYALMAASGLQYGRAFRRLRAVHQGERGGGAAGRLAAAAADAADGFGVNPATLDGLLQLGATVPEEMPGRGAAAAAQVPAALELFAPPAAGEAFWSTAAERAEPLVGFARRGAPPPAAAGAPARPQGRATYRDHVLCAAGGAVACVVQGLEARPAAALATAPAAALAAAQPRARQAAGGDPAEEEMLYDIEWAVAAVAEDAEAAGGPAPAAVPPLATLTLTRRAGAGAAAGATVAALQALPATAPKGAGVLALPGGASAAGAALGGVLRTFAQEQPALGLTSWQPSGAAGACASAAGGPDGALAQAQPAGALALLPPGALPAGVAPDGYGSRLAAGAALVPALQRSAALAAPAPFNLTPVPRGSLGSLVPQPVSLDAPRPAGTVLMAVKAVGLNFRDVLNVSGGLGVAVEDRGVAQLQQQQDQPRQGHTICRVGGLPAAGREPAGQANHITRCAVLHRTPAGPRAVPWQCR